MFVDGLVTTSANRPQLPDRGNAKTAHQLGSAPQASMFLVAVTIALQPHGVWNPYESTLGVRASNENPRKRVSRVALSGVESVNK